MGLLAGTFFSQGVLLDFAPTYNGAQSPTVVAAVNGKFKYSNFGPGSSNATGSNSMTVTNAASDCTIDIDTSFAGGPTNNGSTQTSDREIFALNQRPDSVKIRRLTADYTDSDHINYPSTVPKVGTFTDGSEFDPVNGVLYGYTALCDVHSNTNLPTPPEDLETGQVISIVEFTFKKDGYNTLVLLYKIQANAHSFASNLS